MLGALESRVMRVLWAVSEPLSVREVRAALADDGTTDSCAPAYTTVLTVMTRLTHKGVLDRIRVGRRHVYRPLVEDEAALAVRGLLSDYGEAAVTHFVDQANNDPRLRDRLRALLDEER